MRRLEFDINEYQDFLQKKLLNFIGELYKLGCHKIVVAGLPPIRCLPIQMTTKLDNPKDQKCIKDENLDAQIYNYKLSRLLYQLQGQLHGSKLVYANVYNSLINIINSPYKYAISFVEMKRGCCAIGLVEIGPLYNLLTPTCNEASKYVFWESIHPSEAAYKYLSIYLEKEVLPKLSYSNQTEPLAYSSGSMSVY